MLRWCIVFLFFPVLSWAQSYRFTHLDQRQGLSQNTVTAVLKDVHGWMWVGTQDGLNRYDGYTFHTYRSTQNDTTSLTDNYVLALAQDQRQRLWVGTRNGLCYYDPTTDKFVRYYFIVEDRTHFHGQVNTLVVLPDTAIAYKHWSGKWIKLKVVDKQIQASAFPETVRQVYAVNDAVVIAQPETVTLESGKQKRIFQQSNLLVSSIRGMQVDEQYLYYLRDRTLYRFSFDRPNDVQTLFALDTRPTALLRDDLGRIWIGTTTGLYVLDHVGTPEQTWVKLIQEEGNSSSLASSRIESLYASPDGLIWVGTSGGGVSIYDPQQLHFILPAFDIPALSKPVWLTFPFRDQVLVATATGCFWSKPENARPSWWNAFPQQLHYTSACFDRRGRLWLGTKSNGVLALDTLSKKLTTFHLRNELQEEMPVNALACDGHGAVWVAAIGGLFQLASATDVMVRLDEREAATNKYLTNYFSSIRFDRNGNGWIGTNKGVIRVDALTGQVRVFANRVGDTTSLSFNMVNDLLIDSKGRIWVATMGNGFDLLDPQTGRCTNFSMHHGLPNNMVYGIEEDAHGKMWISTNEGLVCFDPQQKTFLQFTRRDGLPSNEFVIHTHGKDAQGHLYFGSASGLVSFSPEQLLQRDLKIVPLVTQFFVNYQKWPCDGQSAILLEANQRNIGFEFSVVDYRFQDKIRYAYQLVGFDSEWRELSPGNRMAVYTNLPYGDYTFQVRYKLAGESWQDLILQIPVHIATPFWATWWFVLLSIALGVLVLSLVIRYLAQVKLRRKLRALEMVKKVQDEKERISRDLHDNVGAQLTYIISSLDHVSYKLEQGQALEPARKKVNDLGEFARNTMQQLRESIWAINSETIRLSELHVRIQDYMQQQAEHQEELETSATYTGEDVAMPPVLSIEIFRILQEAISNVVKHAQASRLELKMVHDNGGLSITLLDNGIGFETGVEKIGHYGLKNMQKRALSIGAHLEMETELGKGTVLRLYIDSMGTPKSGN